MSSDYLIKSSGSVLFLPALVIPWLSVKGTGARAVSVAPKPYYLWIGARKKLFLGFATLGLFFFSFLVSVYYGNSIGTILGYCADYAVPLAATSLVAGLLYADCFSKTLCRGICEDFCGMKEAGNPRQKRNRNQARRTGWWARPDLNWSYVHPKHEGYQATPRARRIR